MSVGSVVTVSGAVGVVYVVVLSLAITELVLEFGEHTVLVSTCDSVSGASAVVLRAVAVAGW